MKTLKNWQIMLAGIAICNFITFGFWTYCKIRFGTITEVPLSDGTGVISHSWDCVGAIIFPIVFVYCTNRKDDFNIVRPKTYLKELGTLGTLCIFLMGYVAMFKFGFGLSIIVTLFLEVIGLILWAFLWAFLFLLGKILSLKRPWSSRM